MARPPEEPQRPKKGQKKRLPKPAQRQPVTPGTDDRAGAVLRELRIQKKLTLWEAASRMQVDGQPHSSVAYTLARIEQDGATKDLKNQLAKAWARGESGEQAMTLSWLRAAAHALEVGPARLIEMMGFDGQAFSAEDALATDTRLSRHERELLLLNYRAMVSRPDGIAD